MSATDQGIELRVVRVLADKNGGTAYLEAEDLAGERLHESAALESYRDPDRPRRGSRYGTVCPRTGRYRSVPDGDGDVYTVEFSRIFPSVELFSHLFRGNF